MKVNGGRAYLVKVGDKQKLFVEREDGMVDLYDLSAESIVPFDSGITDDDIEFPTVESAEPD